MAPGPQETGSTSVDGNGIQLGSFHNENKGEANSLADLLCSRKEQLDRRGTVCSSFASATTEYSAIFPRSNEITPQPGEESHLQDGKVLQRKRDADIAVVVWRIRRVASGAICATV
jgi:hypothetical protein